jgi:hypothetical protein
MTCTAPSPSSPPMASASMSWLPVRRAVDPAERPRPRDAPSAGAVDVSSRCPLTALVAAAALPLAPAEEGPPPAATLPPPAPAALPAPPAVLAPPPSLDAPSNGTPDRPRTCCIATTEPFGDFTGRNMSTRRSSVGGGALREPAASASLRPPSWFTTATRAMLSGTRGLVAEPPC